MTEKEQTLLNLKKLKSFHIHNGNYDPDIDRAIKALEQQSNMVSRGAYVQVMWERDVAIDQLKELGYGFGEKTETDKDVISRQAVLDYIDKMPSELTSDGRRMVRRRALEEYISDTLPPVIPQQKTGQWIYKQYGSYPEQGDYHCSECDNIDNRAPAYCPNCGAKMRGDHQL